MPGRDDIVAKLADRRVVASVSGGKDSAALSLHLREPCVFSSKEDIANVARIDPGRIDEIRQLEADVQNAARARYAAKGETFESLGYEPPTFFKMREAGQKNGHPKPIDEVVAWARTSHGGRQLKLLDPDPAAGCMRWGLCDAAPEPSPHAPGEDHGDDAPEAEPDQGPGSQAVDA